jgi:hypothetical protein
MFENRIRRMNRPWESQISKADKKFEQEDKDSSFSEGNPRYLSSKELSEPRYRLMYGGVSGGQQVADPARHISFGFTRRTIMIHINVQINF